MIDCYFHPLIIIFSFFLPKSNIQLSSHITKNIFSILPYRFDPQTSQWKFVAPNNSPRSTLGCAVLDGKLYAVGGRDGSSCLSSVEVYDPHTDKWTIAAPLLKRRAGKMAFERTFFFPC